MAHIYKNLWPDDISHGLSKLAAAHAKELELHVPESMDLARFVGMPTVADAMLWPFMTSRHS